jgi:hypothetical protein
MRIALPVWFEVESLEDGHPTMSQGQMESAAAHVADELCFLHCHDPDHECDAVAEGFGKARVKLLGIDPD